MKGIIRIATYNIRNTMDRYEERELLLKNNLYGFGADIIGLQEVAFNEIQLKEVLKAKNRLKIQDCTHERYSSFEAQTQVDMFALFQHLDPRANIDGNAILTSDDIKVIDHRILHLSAVRNVQLLVIQLFGSRKMFFANTHLHHDLGQDMIRQHQSLQLITWIQKQNDLNFDDLIVIVGDFNASPESETYKLFQSMGYTSAMKQYHGEEPEKTFPTGLKAPYMDTDPPGTFDYIFIKGRCNILDARVAGHEPAKNDHTIYGSDHMAIVADLQIS